MELPTARWRTLIAAAVEHYDLPSWDGQAPVHWLDPSWDGLAAVHWLEGLIMTESSGNPSARRYERHQDVPGRSADDTPGIDDYTREDNASYGLAQVMGWHLRSHLGVGRDHILDYTLMLDPFVSITLGCTVLRDNLKVTEGDVARALARYNGGWTGDKIQPDGRMRRQVYVDKVRKWGTAAEAEVKS